MGVGADQVVCSLKREEIRMNYSDCSQRITDFPRLYQTAPYRIS